METMESERRENLLKLLSVDGTHWVSQELRMHEGRHAHGPRGQCQLQRSAWMPGKICQPGGSIGYHLDHFCLPLSSWSLIFPRSASAFCKEPDLTIASSPCVRVSVMP